MSVRVAGFEWLDVISGGDIIGGMAPDGDIRVQRSIRFPPEVDEALVEWAASHGCSVNAAVVIACDGLVLAAERSAVELNRAGRRDVTPGERERLREDVAEVRKRLSGVACPHPRSARKVFGWGAKCGDCGARL